MGHSKNIIYMVGTTVSLFCQWLIMMLIPIITDFSEAGIFAVALSICSILNIFATFSLNQYQISDQYLNYSESEYRTARLLTISFSFILCISVVLLFNYTLEQSLVIILYMVYRNILHYAYLHTATLQIRDRLDYVGYCTILEGIVSIISFTLVYYLTTDLVLSVAVMAVLGGGIFLLAVSQGYRKTVGRRFPSKKVDRNVVISIIKLGVPLLLSAVAPIIITALPKILLQASEGNEIAGIFSTLSAPTIVIPTLITSMFIPYIVYFSNISRGGNIHLLRKKYAKAIAITLLFGAACFILSRFFGEFAFELLYGADIVPYVKYFDILIVGITLYSIGMCGITVLITKEQGRAAAVASGMALLSALIIFMAMMPRFGINEATYALLASYGIFGLLISLCVILLPLKNVIKSKEVIH